MDRSKKVLIIDDEIDLCLLLKGHFLRKGFEVFLAHSLEDGLRKLDETAPDILFLDNNLPDGTGWNKAPMIAEHYPRLFINLISAYHPSLPEMPKEARFQVIEKPFSLADLNPEREQAIR